MKPQDPHRRGNGNPRSGQSQGKHMENPASPDLAGDIGKRKTHDYPGVDEGLTGERSEERSSRQGPLGTRHATGGSQDQGRRSVR